jgi:transposase
VLTPVPQEHQKKNESQALGRSRGGFSTKIHATVDGLGYPLRFQLTAGQAHDITQAQALVAGFKFERVIADRGYSSQAFVESLLQRGSDYVIPPHQRAKQPRDFDRHLYRERHLVECFFNKLKHFRRLFSRFDKRADRFLAFLHLSAALIWLR